MRRLLITLLLITAAATVPGAALVTAASETRETMIQVTIQVDDKAFEAILSDHDAARALAQQLPMTVNMKELNGNEKYYDLPAPLPESAEQIGEIHAGDLMLFGSDCLVLFYEDFDTAYRYTRLGAVQDPSGLAQALGRGDVTVTFFLADRAGDGPPGGPWHWRIMEAVPTGKRCEHVWRYGYFPGGHTKSPGRRVRQSDRGTVPGVLQIG